MKDNPLDMLWVILVLALVFYLTWLVTRFLAARSKGKTAGRFMRVVDRLNISNDKSILLVKVGSEYCVIGVTGHEMRLIKILSDAEAEIFADGADKQAQSFMEGAAADGLWKSMQSFSSRLGFAMKRPAYKKPEPIKPQEAQSDDQSVIDMMNERIRLRKDTRRR